MPDNEEDEEDQWSSMVALVFHGLSVTQDFITKPVWVFLDYNEGDKDGHASVYHSQIVCNMS